MIACFSMQNNISQGFNDVSQGPRLQPQLGEPRTIVCADLPNAQPAAVCGCVHTSE